MIVRMKKLTLLVSQKEREKFLAGLRKAGVLHIKNVKAPESHEITFVEDKISNLEKMIHVLEPYAGESRTNTMASGSAELMTMAQKITDAYTDRQELVSRINELEKRTNWFDLWGGFDPGDLRTLADKGVIIKLFRLQGREFKQLPAEVRCVFAGKKKGYYYVAVLMASAEEQLPYEEMVPPPESPEEMKAMIEEMRGDIRNLDKYLKEEAAGLQIMKYCREALDKEREFFRAKGGMQEEGKFAYLQGYCPDGAVAAVISLADKRGAGYLIEDAEETPETPTLVTNPAWIRIIQPVFDFMSTIPGYDEFDISFVFLVFFSLFFAMLVGDAGYGFLFLVVTYLARRKFKNAPREPFFLMYVLSAATIVWGAITGSWFGLSQALEIPFFKGMMIEKLDTSSAEGQHFVIHLCFLIGAIHLTIAHLLKIWRGINTPRALADAGWIMIVWGMFFAAGTLVLSRPFPGFGLYLYFAGIPLVLFFANFQKNWIKGALTTLVDLPLSVISSFSDVVSYLRLFAVGYAGAMLSGTFNNMMLGDMKGLFSGFAAAIVLFLGHALNIVLCFLAVAVHGIRLNMLEFSGHLGMGWSGKKYEPFKE